MHPEVTKIQVAEGIIKGMIELPILASHHEYIPSVNFAYDNDAFRKAWNDLELTQLYECEWDKSLGGAATSSTGV